MLVFLNLEVGVIFVVVEVLGMICVVGWSFVELYIFFVFMSFCSLFYGCLLLLLVFIFIDLIFMLFKFDRFMLRGLENFWKLFILSEGL